MSLPLARSFGPRSVVRLLYRALVVHGPRVSARHLIELLIAPLPKHSTFLDLGCAKGRAVLLASRYPFLESLLDYSPPPQLRDVVRDVDVRRTCEHQWDVTDRPEP